MAGYDLKQGKKPFIPMTEESLIELIEKALSKSHRTTSYKYAFFQAILDTLDKVENCFLTYDTIFFRCTEIYWDLVLIKHIKQMPVSKNYEMTGVERKLQNFVKKHKEDCIHENSVLPFYSISKSLQTEIKNKVFAEMKKNVIGAFWKDTKGQIYSFDIEESGIIFNSYIFPLLKKHKEDFLMKNNCAFDAYLQKQNTRP